MHSSAMEPQVSTVSALMVSPSALPCSPSLLPLSNLDQFSPSFVGMRFDMVMLFQKRNDQQHKHPPRIIREALSKTLSYYQPLAGRLRTKNGRLHVECAGQGAFFIEANCNFPLSLLLTNDAAAAADVDEVALNHPTLRADLLFNLPANAVVEDIPPLIIQVTVFNCGGFSVGASFNHNICDGKGAAMFLHQLAELSRATLREGLPSSTKRDGNPPSFQRELFWARQPPQVQFIHKELMPNANKTSHSKNVVSVKEEPQLRCVIVRRDALKRLQWEGEGENGQGVKWTSFEVLAALVWKARTKALGIAGEDELRLIFPVDFRNVFSRPLLRHEFGNCVFSACVSEKAVNVVNAKLIENVRRVREAKERVTEDYVRSAIDFIELSLECQHNHNDKDNEEEAEIVGGVEDMYVSDWRWLGVESVDLGWGAADVVSPASWICNSSSCLLMSAPQHIPAFRVFVCLPAHLFQSFFSQLKSSFAP